MTNDEALALLREARRDGDIVFSSLWGACRNCRGKGYHNLLEPTERRICDYCKGKIMLPRHFADPLEAVGPVLRDWFAAIESEIGPIHASHVTAMMWSPEVRWVFEKLVEECIARGWLPKEVANA